MKNLFVLFLAMLTLAFTSRYTHTAKAQIVKSITIVAADDTLADTDTAIVVIPVVNNTVSATVNVDKVSGTVAGTVYLEATVDNITYDKLDSLTLANQAVNNKTFNLHGGNNKLMYASYRFEFITSGTQKCKPKVYTTRRSD
ncbi:MAG: hypothetical protein ACTHKV_03770 [Flavipsychrobacter sp.]